MVPPAVSQAGNLAYGGQESAADLLLLADVQEALQDVLLAQLGVAHDGAAGLDGLDDLGAGVAGQREARGIGVYLHCPPQRLLSASGHAACTDRAWEVVGPT